MLNISRTKDLIQNLKDNNNIILFTPVNLTKINFINTMLSSSNFPTIPEDYKIFLQITNGIIFNFYELYGINNIKRNNYIYPNIYDINQTFKHKNKILPNNLIIGSAPSCVITYNSINKNYEIKNNIIFETIFKFNNFETLLKHIEQIINN